MSAGYLPAGLPLPDMAADALSGCYWQGLIEGRLQIQHCACCGTWQFGPEWLCHHCHQFDPPFQTVPAEGTVYSWERVWQPSHPALIGRGPYLVALIELPHAGGVRLLGNLLGDALLDPVIGAAVEGVFEQHADERSPFALLQWRLKP